MHTCTHTHSPSHAHMCCIHVHTRARRHIHAFMHTCAHTCRHANVVHTCVTHTCVWVHTRAHKHTHTSLRALAPAASDSSTISPAGRSARPAKMATTPSPSEARWTRLLVAHGYSELLLHDRRFSPSPLHGLQCSQDPSDGVWGITGALQAPHTASFHRRCTINTARGAPGWLSLPR